MTTTKRSVKSNKKIRLVTQLALPNLLKSEIAIIKPARYQAKTAGIKSIGFWDYNKWLKKLEGWIWLVLLISTVFYLKWLLIEANLETKKLMGEREQFQTDMSDQQKKMQSLQDNMKAQINNPIEEFMNMIKKDNRPSASVKPETAVSTTTQCKNYSI